MKKIFAVIDTNVFVSALLAVKTDSPTVVIMQYISNGILIPLYNDEILIEYKEVLSREKFNFSKEKVQSFLTLIQSSGICLPRTVSNEIFVDEKDAVFYEIALSLDGSYLVTGNLKHFPKTPIVITPAEMVSVIEKELLQE